MEKQATTSDNTMDDSQEQKTMDNAQEQQTTPSPLPTANGPVDGGLTCWLQVAGSFGIWANSWGLINAFGEFQTYYQQEYPHISPSSISWVGSIQAFLLLFLGIIAGPLYDAGYFRHLLIFGNFMVVFGLMMTSITNQFWQIVITQGIVSGIGFGFLFIPGVGIIPQYFVKRRVLANGIAAVGSGLAGVIYPIILHRLVPKIGFGWTVRVIAFITLFVGVVSVATLKNKIPAGKMRRMIDPSTFRNTPLTIYACSLFLVCVAMYIPVFYIGSYAISHGMDPELAFYLVPILQATNMFGRVAPNLIADKTGPLNITIPAMFSCAILALAWIGIKNDGGIIAFVAIYGVFYGIVQSIPPACTASLITDMKTIGTQMGTVFAMSSFGVLIGTPISGAILDSTGSYVGVQAFAGCVLAAAAMCIVAARVKKVGWGIAQG